MALEARDISDKDILLATRQTRTADGESIQLSIDLPSGRRITSDPFRPGAGVGALLAWCEVIRQARVDDAAEARARARRVAEEAKAAARVPGSADDDPKRTGPPF